jgi:four helix bundle protein
MGRGVRRFTDLRAWQACTFYKKAVYRLCLDGPLARDLKRREQLEESVKGPPAHIAEGYGRFSPPDSARYTVIARSSLMESQNHLLDAVDKGYLTEETRLELNALAEEALQEVTGLMEYLQSPEALRNARRARERRIATRQERRNKLPASEDESSNDAPRESEPENTEPRTQNSEPRTQNPELRTRQRTKNRAPRTPNRT